MTLYFATVLPGLEAVLEDEIRAKIGDARIATIERGKVYFTSSREEETLRTLRTADNLFRFVHRFRVGPHKTDLHHIEREIAALDLDWVADGRSGPVRCAVHASRSGKHTYSRFDASSAAMIGLTKRRSRFREGAGGNHEVEFRLDIAHDEAVFALRLTDSSFRYRKPSRAFAPAAIRPTVAHALVWLSKPAPSDTFVDPCCGSGTIVIERLAYPSRRIVGGDIDEDAVRAAVENAGNEARLRLHRWDARRLPLDAGSVDKLVVNLPFGKQIGSGETIPALYRDIVNEADRVLTGGGTVICMTDAAEPLERAAERFSFEVRELASLSLKGLHPSVYKLAKR
ncbi:methyltransferase domain-containing protein [Paenibacillus sp. GYB003]|uniref:methyltransferase domain-containing protein n=1 Tax=Paenibacillus sp. GYB003 TaxID=2994392 RepID=UPI002F96BFF5